ncbi:MurR/RpiR family transcriptional regulator, partial [Lachnotalea glycerini]
MNSELTVLELIKDNYQEIFSAERKVADFILKNPENAVNSNVSELAQKSGVSDATIIRFCKHIGFQGYYQMRIQLSADLGRHSAANMLNEIDESDPVSSMFQRFANNLIEIGRNISVKEMEYCVGLINGADHVHLIAVGNTSPHAMYMGFRLERLGVHATYNMLPEYMMNHINLAKENDIIIALSESGSSKQIIQMLDFAKRKGLKNIVITGYRHSPVSKYADCLLLTKVAGEAFDYLKEYSHLNCIAVVDAVLE